MNNLEAEKQRMKEGHAMHTKAQERALAVVGAVLGSAEYMPQHCPLCNLTGFPRQQHGEHCPLAWWEEEVLLDNS